MKLNLKNELVQIAAINALNAMANTPELLKSLVNGPTMDLLIKGIIIAIFRFYPFFSSSAQLWSELCK